MTEEKLKLLLESLPLEEKAAQLTQWMVSQLRDTTGAVTGTEVGRVHSDYYGSLLNFAAPEEAEQLQKEYFANCIKSMPISSVTERPADSGRRSGATIIRPAGRES